MGDISVVWIVHHSHKSWHVWIITVSLSTRFLWEIERAFWIGTFTTSRLTCHVCINLMVIVIRLFRFWNLELLFKQNFTLPSLKLIFHSDRREATWSKFSTARLQWSQINCLTKTFPLWLKLLLLFNTFTSKNLPTLWNIHFETSLRHRHFSCAIVFFKEISIVPAHSSAKTLHRIKLVIRWLFRIIELIDSCIHSFNINIFHFKMLFSSIQILTRLKNRLVKGAIDLRLDVKLLNTSEITFDQGCSHSWLSYWKVLSYLEGFGIFPETVILI